MSSRRGSSHRLLLAGCLVGSALLHGWALVQAWEAARPAAASLPRRAAGASPGAMHLAAIGAAAVLPPASLKYLSQAPSAQPVNVGDVAKVTLLAPSDLGELAPLGPARGAAAAVAIDDWETYLPRPLLTLAPRPQEPVMLTWPEFHADAPHYEAVLALYIDETGRVQAVRVQGQDLPAPLVEAARQAFEGRRFLPGELQGQAVKSRIFVEVSFDQELLPASGIVHSPGSLSR